MTGEIGKTITADISVMAVCERLYVLMGLEAVTAMSDGGSGDESTESRDEDTNHSEQKRKFSDDEISIEAELSTAIKALEAVEAVLSRN